MFDISEQDLDELWTILNQVFNSNKTDDQIQKDLEQISNSNATYSEAVMPYIEMMLGGEDTRFDEIYKILREC